MTIFKQVQKIVQASQHRPLHFETATHQQFVQKQLAKITAFSKLYPFINFKHEYKKIQSQLIDSL